MKMMTWSLWDEEDNLGDVLDVLASQCNKKVKKGVSVNDPISERVKENLKNYVLKEQEKGHKVSKIIRDLSEG